MQHLITRHQGYFSTTFKDFVLCIDDSQIAVNRLFYGCSEEKDLFRYIEHAASEADIPGVKTHLAISASDPRILRRTSAQQRKVVLLNQQGNVSVDFVLDHIWNKPFEKYGLQAAYAKIKKRLAFFAHGTIEILWSVQIIYIYLEDYLNTNSNFDESKFDDLTQFLNRGLQSFLYGQYSPSASYTQIYPLLLGKEMNLDDSSMDIDRYRYLPFTNRAVPSSVPGQVTKMIPEGSLFGVLQSNSQLFEDISRRVFEVNKLSATIVTSCRRRKRRIY
jgi:hypothetical protein